MFRTLIARIIPSVLISLFLLTVIASSSAETAVEYRVNGRPLTDMSIEELYQLEDALYTALNDVFAMNSKISPSGDLIGTYIINPRSKKFHYPYCLSALQIGYDRQFQFCSASELVGQGFKPCGQCQPYTIPEK